MDRRCGAMKSDSCDTPTGRRTNRATHRQDDASAGRRTSKAPHQPGAAPARRRTSRGGSRNRPSTARSRTLAHATRRPLGHRSSNRHRLKGDPPAACRPGRPQWRSDGPLAKQPTGPDHLDGRPCRNGCVAAMTAAPPPQPRAPPRCNLGYQWPPERLLLGCPFRSRSAMPRPSGAPPPSTDTANRLADCTPSRATHSIPGTTRHPDPTTSRPAGMSPTKRSTEGAAWRSW
jgi:hypothetical protein